MNSAKEVVATDLDYICDKLSEEMPQMSGKRLLIIGGGGFLGYYLVQSVLHWNKRNPSRAPIDLTVFDNYIRGVPDWLTGLNGDPHLTLRKHDVVHPMPADAGNFQFIIHAASIASPTFYRQYPIETMDANVNGLRLLLDYCVSQKAKGTPVEAMLFYSTSEIYGDPTPESIPTPETYRGNVSCTGPRACYDESKRYGETLCVNFAAQHGVPVKMARPFNNYGPGLKITDRRVLPDFARNVFAGEDIVMLSDGSPTRTFCYIADAIVGYYKIMLRGRPGEAYNIGVEGPEVSMKQVAEHVAALSKDLFGYTGKVITQTSSDKDYLVDNPNRRCPVLQKARTELAYNPSITLDEGMKRIMLWYRDNQQAVDA
jgi:nucleoside-diphosphate-sugar epimerase